MNSFEVDIRTILSVVGVAPVLVVLLAANIKSLVENVGADPVGLIAVPCSGLGEDLSEVLSVVLS